MSDAHGAQDGAAYSAAAAGGLCAGGKLVRIETLTADIKKS